MSSIKKAIAVLDPLQSLDSDTPTREEIDPRDTLKHELKEKLENKIKQTLRDIKASPLIEIEARELMHQRMERVDMLAHNVKSDDAFRQAVEGIIETSIGFIKHLASEEHEKHDDHEKHEGHTAHPEHTHGDDIKRHEAEKPQTPVDRTVDAIKKGVKSGRPDQPATVYTNKNNPLMAFKQELEKKNEQTKQSPSKRTGQKSKSGNKKPSKTTSPLKPTLSMDSPVISMLTGIEKNKQAMERSKPIPVGSGAWVNPFSLPTQQAKAHSTISSQVQKTAGQGTVQPTAPATNAPPPKIVIKTIPVRQNDVSPSDINMLNEDGEELMDRGLAVTGNPDEEVEQEVREKRLDIYQGPETYTGVNEEYFQDQKETFNYTPNMSPEDQENEAQGAQNGRKRKRNHALLDRVDNKLMQKAAQQAVLAIGRHPVVLAALLIILIVLYLAIVIYLIAVGNDEAQKLQQQQTAIPVTISKTGPPTGSIGQKLTYTISVGYAGQAQNVQIVDMLPPDTKYVDSTPPGVYDATANTVTWDANALKLTLANPLALNVNITLEALKNNLYILNKASATVQGGVPSGGGTSPGYNPPTADNCKGKYNLTSNRFLPKNFGDPTCTATKPLINAKWTTADSANAAWWQAVTACESSYNPNAWNDPDNGPRKTPDAGGAWGLVQDGSSSIATPETLYLNSTRTTRRSVVLQDLTQLPGLPAGTWGHGGQYDRGDVNWETQIDNAVQLFKKRGKAYWACG